MIENILATAFFVSIILLFVFGIMWAENSKHGKRNFLIDIPIIVVLFLSFGIFANNDQDTGTSTPETSDSSNTSDDKDMDKEVTKEEYTDDMAGEIKQSVNDNESISANKVSVDGQFDAKPKTMAISIRSDDFTGKHDEDYLSILDAIKVSQKHNISDFSNVKYVLVGKLTDRYKDSYEPIAWFNFSGKSLKGLKTNEVTLDMLEGIANDYHFKPLK
ncbi:hypothetical protein DY124_06355 [Apilactobacillus micheneri]|uniref:hypothetical protein n=1 Tax=Apilactobacillus micheneri TaxID=1899430 RepID=UPI001129D587|nr:hypothetical protein [Apilactobacillus micheneri]TPR43195.1 hypothetical protein DY124_06355 [Apilactobacillus micheneri]TPR47032.1 hypothetical protein DY125_07715 [Apilactobacillus micheneri]